MANKLKGIGCFAAGAGVGAVVALLCAPRSGKHTRARIRNSANRTLHRAAEMREDVRAYMSEMADDASETVASGIGTCKQSAGASGERIKQTLGKVRERIDHGRERVEQYVRSIAQ
jgi:gas vesicle protein